MSKEEPHYLRNYLFDRGWLWHEAAVITPECMLELEQHVQFLLSKVCNDVIGVDDIWDKKYPLSIKQDIKSRNHLRLEQRRALDELVGKP